MRVARRVCSVVAIVAIVAGVGVASGALTTRRGSAGTLVARIAAQVARSPGSEFVRYGRSSAALAAGLAANSSCGPATTAGSGSASLLMASATEVAAGTIEGLSWSLWSKTGQHGADGLEDGGLVVSGTAYGLCPGYPNPAELELLDPGAGQNGIVYGVVGYPGSAKVDIYASKVGTFDRGNLLASPATKVVNGVAFFIAALPASACSYRALELNTTSARDSAEHNLGFGGCTPGELVPITASQGIWQLPPGHFPVPVRGTGGGRGVPAGENIYPPGADPRGAAAGELRGAPQTAELARSQLAAELRLRTGRPATVWTFSTRFVQTMGGYRIYLDVEQFIWPGQDNLPARSFVLNVDAVDRHGNVSSTSFGPNTQFTAWPFDPYPNIWVSVVPDGVASVTWTFTCTRAEVGRDTPHVPRPDPKRCTPR